MSPRRQLMLAVVAELVLAGSLSGTAGETPAGGQLVTIELEASVLEFAPSRDDLAVSVAVLTLHGSSRFKVNGKEVEDRWKYIELEEAGKNNFRLPALKIEFSEEDRGFLCMSVKVWFDKLANEFDSLFYETTDDRYALVSYCTQHAGRDARRFTHNRVTTVEEFKETLKKPMVIKLNRRRVPSPGLAIDERGTVFAFAFLPAVPLEDRSQLWKLDADGALNRVPLVGPRTAAWRSAPHAPCTGRGATLYLSGLWKISPDGTVSTVLDALKGSSPAHETPVAADPDGNLYFGSITLRRGDTPRRVQLARIDRDGAVHIVAGSTEGHEDGAGDRAQFLEMTAIAVGPSGDPYVADGRVGQASWIRRVGRDGNVTTIAGSNEVGFRDGTGTAARFRVVSGLSVDREGNVHVADRFNGAIRKITPDGKVTTIAGRGSSKHAAEAALDASFEDPAGVVVAPDGSVFVLDGGWKEARIRRISPDGKIATVALLR